MQRRSWKDLGEIDVARNCKFYLIGTTKWKLESRSGDVRLKAKLMRALARWCLFFSRVKLEI